MPEGPSIVILKELVQPFKGLKIKEVTGNSKLDIHRMQGQVITDFKSWGKHFLICMPGFTMRVHFMLFGSYRINDPKEAKPRLGLTVKNGETLNFYTCSLKIIEEDLDDMYDWAADVMSDAWNPRAARKKLQRQPDMLACDALLNQDIFAGVGNIIKNEVLFRIRVHPLSRVGALPRPQLSALVKEARKYSFDFLEWKKKYELKKHYMAYNRKTCPRDHVPFLRADLGKTRRRTFYCEICEELFE